MRKLLAISASLLIFYSPFAFAHHGTTEFGQLESVGLNDFHFHLPMSVDLEGKVTFGIHGLGEHDHGDMADEEMGSDHADPMDHADHHHASVEFMPMIRFNWEKVERNVCSQKTALTLLDLNVPLATNCAPMWNIKKRQLALGAGLAAHFAFGGIGIIPTKDTSVYQKHAVQPGKGRETKIEFPGDISGFSSWETGDYISYEKSLGLMLHVDIPNPIPLLMVGPGAGVTNSWKVSFEKASPTAVHAMITTTKMGMVGAEVGTALAGLGYDFGKTKGLKFHFVINLNEVRADEAYELLLKGEIEDLLRLAASSKAVVDLGKDEMKGNIRSGTVSGGVPILFGARSARGEMKTVSIHDQDHKMDSTLIFRERGTQGLLSRHKLAGEYLAGSVENVESDSFGHFGFVALFSFEKEKLNDTRLERKLNGFMRDLGFSGKTRISLPDDSDGYLRGETKVSFSSASLKALVNMIQSEKEMLAFLANSGMAEDTHGLWLYRWTRIASKLRKAHKTGNTLAYSRQLTLLARELLEESVLFHSWIKSTGGVNVSVHVLGEKIPESSFTATAVDLL